MSSEFRNSLGERIFDHKYRQGANDSWANLARRIVDDVCGTRGGTLHPLMSKEDREDLVHLIRTFRFVPGGRYLYYAGRKASFYNNCYLLRAEEDTREEWANLVQRALSCLSTGGGIGIDYSILRPEGYELKRTGGRSSGPLPLMKAVNEIGRCVMQGGSRRSAIYASLNWQHEDVDKFLHMKDWETMPIGAQKFWEEERPYTFRDAKMDDFNFPCPMDMTNISVNYDNAFLAQQELPEVFIENVRQAMRTGEPGFSFNFGDKENETLRNACTEVTSEDDSDV
jgi:ribonucleoside-diphosphate reductase alpha chain